MLGPLTAQVVDTALPGSKDAASGVYTLAALAAGAGVAGSAGRAVVRALV